MKKLTSIFVVFAIVLTLFSSMPVSVGATGFNGTAADAFAGGTGTPGDPYEIATASQLALANERINDVAGTGNTLSYELVADIDYENNSWTPLGTEGHEFTGKFYGNGHTISNIKIQNTTSVVIYQYVGFFGRVLRATIENLGIDNIQILVSGTSSTRIHSIGGMFGLVNGNATSIKNCFVKNSSVRHKTRYNNETAAVGGFAGVVWGGTIENCYVYNVSLCSGAERASSGFVGSLYYSGSSNVIKFSNCYAADITIDRSGTTGPSNDPTTYSFGYKQDATATITTSNCYSTFEGKTSTYDNPWVPAYSTANDIGTYTTKDNINTVFRALDAFGISTTVNGGEYPCLIFEDEALMPTPTPTATPDPNATAAPLQDINLVLIGDSLMDSENNGSSYSWRKYGWEAYIGNYVNDEKVSLVKHGHSGWTVQYFMERTSAYGKPCGWETIKTQFGEGDYVIIALGTNDNSRLDGTHSSESYTVEQFKAWYKKIIDDVRAKGAEILVLTPPPTNVDVSITNSSVGNAALRYTTNALLELKDEPGYEDLAVINIGEAYAANLNSIINAGTYTASDIRYQTENGTATGPGLIYVDFCHFTEYGANLLAWTVANEVAKKTTGLENYVVSTQMPQPPTPTPTPTPVPTPTPIPGPTLAPLDITGIPGGIKYFGQNFDDAAIVEGDRVTTSMGFSVVADTGSDKNAQYFVAGDEITDVSETSNRVMRVVPKIVQARATEEQFAALMASETSVKWGTDTYKAIDFIDGYYIAIPSTATSRNTSLYWFKKSSVVDGVLTSTKSGTDYDTTFYTDENGTITNVSKGITGTSLTFSQPADDAGKYAIQFNYAYPDNGNMRTGQEGFNLQIDGGEYHIRKTGVFRGYGYTKRELDFGTNGTSPESTATNKWVPMVGANADIPHYFLSTDDYSSQLTELSERVDMTWYTVMVYVDIDNKFYTIYLDGYPLYFKAENGGYSCRMMFSKDTLAPIMLWTNRLCVFNDHAPVFDNFLGYYSTGSDEETVERVLKNIVLPYVDAPVISSDIIFDKAESDLVTWSFDSDAFVIDEENPLIARYNAPFGKGTTTVKLTATCNYGTATGTKEFVLTVKNREKYEVDSVVIKDASGNRIYRPLDNSVIESVSYTANSTETAEMYLAVYESDGRLKCATKAFAQDGKCTFNQAINADETYKVFLWENGTVTPLAVPEMGEYPESDTPTIYVIGDSIAQTYTSTTKDIRGFGQYLDTAFTGVTVDNTQAIGGRTTKYALAEDRLKYVLDNAVSGDYLFIMLGHNDEKLGDYYGATLDEYKAIFTQMVNGANDKGVTPVILTSLARPQYPDGVLVDSHDGYRQALYEVAEKTGTALIDVDTISRNVLAKYTYFTYETLGYFVPADTHTTEKGAKWVVSIIKDELAKMNLPISEYLK